MIERKPYPIVYRSGELCPEHPYAGGLRLLCEHVCALCVYHDNWDKWPEKAYGVNTRAKDNELTDSRYFGQVCKKHPDLGGLRRSATHSCVACFREAGQRRTARKQLALLREWLPAEMWTEIEQNLPFAIGLKTDIYGESSDFVGLAPKTAESQVYGKVCEKHPELTGLRTKKHLCVECQIEKKRERRRLESLEGVHRITTTPSLQ